MLDEQAFKRLKQIKENKNLEEKDTINKKKKKDPNENSKVTPSNLSNNPIINPVNTYDYKKYLQSKNLEY